MSAAFTVKREDEPFFYCLRKKKNIEGTPGFEPGTSRSAVECSTTDLFNILFHFKKSILF